MPHHFTPAARARLLSLMLCCGTPCALAHADDLCDSDACAHAKHALSLWHASGPAGFDQASGRDLRNYPPDRAADLRHMQLRITIPDMNSPKARCEQTLTLGPVAKPLESLTLDARRFTIKEVTSPGRDVSFEHDGMKLSLTFSPPIEPGSQTTVITRYELNDPPRGMIWTPESSAYPGRPAAIHTQGQPETNSYWFPCHDFPNEKLTTEIIATVPQGYLASSNGRLLSRRKTVEQVDAPLGGKRLDAFETFHWLQDKPHVAYLVSLVVGKFDVVDVGDEKLSLPVYVPVGRGKDVRRTYGNTLPMVRFFERVLDEPYPWDRYAQLVATNFEAGGMENTSCTTMHDNAIFSESAAIDRDLDGLIAHELGHQWFGDLTTCNSWEHIWLNEGWATYMDVLWHQHRDGEEGYTREMFEKFDSVLANDTGWAPDQPGMCSKVYDHPWQTFRRAANPYPKGASILHMLRMMLGEDVFWRGVRQFVDEHKFTTVETYELRRAFERASGRQLEQFFHQWCERPGVPSVSVSWTYDPARRKLRFNVEQTQRIDSDNPAFEFRLPMHIRNSAGPDVVIEPLIATRSDTFEVELEGPPRFVAVDPNLHVLARYDVRQDPAMWLLQLREGPSLASRVHAARALSKSDEAAATEMLRRLAGDRNETRLLRVESIRALSARGAVQDVRTLVSTARDHWELRLAVTDALASLATRKEYENDASLREFVSRTLRSRAREDESLKVRCASLKGLARMKDDEAQSIIEETLGVSSFADEARQAALESLAELAPDGSLRKVLLFTRDGFDPRTRVAAAEHAARLAPQDRDAAFETIASMLDARENRVRMGAAEALVKLADARGVAAIQKAEAAARAPEVAQRFRQQREALEKKLAGEK